MASKKRKSYRGTSEQHRTDAWHDAQDMRREHRYFNAALKHNDCVSALHALTKTVRAQSAYKTEIFWTRVPARTSRRAVDKMEVRFARKCLR